MKRKMSERQMWLHIASRIKAARNRKKPTTPSGGNFFVKGIICTGLCGAINALDDNRLLRKGVYDSAKSKITTKLIGNCHFPYAWRVGNLLGRELFCLEQAELLKLLEKKKKPCKKAKS